MPFANEFAPTKANKPSRRQACNSLNGMKRRLSPSASVVPSSTSTSPSAQAALRSTPELWFG
ncbi:hypothetical protein D3C80_414650 [compost metagenome]